VFRITTGAPPHEFHTYINQQDGVLVTMMGPAGQHFCLPWMWTSGEP
jgi:hypothetical protein